jgi:imidazolonepropionase-like amidohydrolase
MNRLHEIFLRLRAEMYFSTQYSVLRSPYLVGCLALAIILAASPAVAGPPHAYKAARIWTGNGPPLQNAVLVVRDGKILAVGSQKDTAIPEDAEVHDLGAAVLIPGLVVAETTLAERGRDDDRALTPEFRAIDGFDFYADYTPALSGGVTTVQVAPGTYRLMPGQGAVVKLAGEDPAARTLRGRESLRILLGNAFKNPPRVYEPPVGAVSVERPLEPTRQQLAASLGAAVAGLRATLRAAKDYPSGGKSEKDVRLAAVAEHLKNGGSVRITAPGAADIRAALALAQEFGLRLILVDPSDLGPFHGQFSSWRGSVGGVILNTEVRPGAVADTPIPEKDAPKRRSPRENAQVLLAAGFKVALRPASDADLGDMLFLGGLFTGGALTDESVLRMLTVHPAEVLGVADRVGSLAAGKDADFVVLNGDPFAAHTRVESVYVNGQPAYSARTAHTGFLDLATGLGLGGPLGNTPVGLPTKLGDRLVSGDPAIAMARQGGVTTVLLAPTGSAAAPVVAFKLGDRPRVVLDPVAIHFGVTGNLTSQAATLRSTLQAARAYSESWARYDTALAEYEKKRKEYEAAKPPAKPDAKPAEGAKGDEKKTDAPKKEEAKAPAEPKPPDKPRVVENLEPYRPLFAGKIPALVEAHRADAIKLAVQVFRDEFKLRTVLLGADDAFRLADLLAEKQVAVAVGPELVRTVEREPVNLAQVLANRGVPFGFQSKATTGVKTLPLAVQYAVHRGLASEDALAGLTAAPARLLSIDGHVGALAVGKDADLVVLSGPPFEPSTRVLAVMIDGQWVYQEEDDR